MGFVVANTWPIYKQWLGLWKFGIFYILFYRCFCVYEGEQLHRYELLKQEHIAPYSCSKLIYQSFNTGHCFSLFNLRVFNQFPINLSYLLTQDTYTYLLHILCFMGSFKITYLGHVIQFLLHNSRLWLFSLIY